MAWTVPLLLWLCSFLVPEHFPPWFSFHAEVPAFAASLVAIWLVAKESKGQIHLPFIIGIPFTLLAIAILQGFFGVAQYWGDVWVFCCYMLCFAGAIFWGAQWAREKSSEEIIKPICFISLLVAIILLFQIIVQWLQIEISFNGWVVDHQTRPFANLGQPNLAATALVMGVISAYALHHIGQMRLSLALFLALLLTFAIALTQSRTGLLSSFLVAAIFWLLPNKNFRKTAWISAFGFVALIAWTILIRSPSGQGVMPLGTSQLADIGTRPLIWKQVIVGMLEHPWLGWGVAGVAAAQQGGALVFHGSEQTNYAHNIILDVATMFGMPATLIFVILVVAYLLKRRKRIVRMDSALWMAIFTLPIGVHSMLELPHAYAFNLLIFGCAWGAIDTWTRPQNANVAVIKKEFVWAGLAGFLILQALVVVDYMRAEEDFRINRLENRRIGTTPEDYKPPKMIVLTQFDEMLQAMRMRAFPGMPTEDVALLQRVSKRYSWAPIQYRTALALGLNGQPILARDQLATIKAMFSDEIYEESKNNWIEFGASKYPVLKDVLLP